jgi:predicted Rossmann fold flavoprotein
MSYQSTGSTGDGYQFAKTAGHKITRLTPSLVPFKVREGFIKELQGLSLKNVSAVIYDGKKKLYNDFGEMLFTHFGVSGPLILSGSSFAADKIEKRNLQLIIDLKPALSEEQLDNRVVREFETYKNKQFKNAIGSLFPAKLIPVMIELSNIDPDKKVNEITKEERSNFVHLIKNVKLTLTKLCDYNQAIITKGGVSVREINPSTMESKLVSNLYFIGEVLDLDALTGGFNLQIAWSTAYAAGAGIW